MASSSQVVTTCELLATNYYLLIVAGELVLEVTDTLLDVAFALVHGALGLLTAVSGDTTDALLDAALDLVAEALRAVLRTVVIGHDSTVVICDGRGVLLPSKGRNREE